MNSSHILLYYFTAIWSYMYINDELFLEIYYNFYKATFCSDDASTPYQFLSIFRNKIKTINYADY